MKKFYENPVVEITVFDTGDICDISGTFSAAAGLTDTTKGHIENVIQTYNNNNAGSASYVGVDFSTAASGGGVYPW